MRESVLTAGALAIGLCLWSAPAFASNEWLVTSSDVVVVGSCHGSGNYTEVAIGRTEGFRCTRLTIGKSTQEPVEHFNFNCQDDTYREHITVSADSKGDLSFSNVCETIPNPGDNPAG